MSCTITELVRKLVRLDIEGKQYGWSDKEMWDRARVELAPLWAKCAN